MQLDVYVNYRGTCEQAFRFYERELGGRITLLVRHATQPGPNIPPDWQVGANGAIPIIVLAARVLISRREVRT